MKNYYPAFLAVNFLAFEFCYSFPPKCWKKKLQEKHSNEKKDECRESEMAAALSTSSGGVPTQHCRDVSGRVLSDNPTTRTNLFDRDNKFKEEICKPKPPIDVSTAENQCQNSSLLYNILVSRQSRVNNQSLKSVSKSAASNNECVHYSGKIRDRQLSDAFSNRHDSFARNEKSIENLRKSDQFMPKILYEKRRNGEGVWIYECGYCAKTRHFNWEIENHVKTHTKKTNIQCNNCSKSFQTHYSLRRHYQIHTGKKPYQCQYCNRKFYYLIQLKRHTSTACENKSQGGKDNDCIRTLADNEKPQCVLQLSFVSNGSGSSSLECVESPSNEPGTSKNKKRKIEDKKF